MFKLIVVATIATVVNCSWTDDLMGFFSKSKNKESGQGNARVVGGETASEHYPYQISMQMKRGNGGGSLFPFLNQNSNKNWSHFCGGSVLNENHIVTAAHCVNGFNTSKMSIFAGTNDLNKEDEGQRRLIESCIMHPEYVELNNSDVAVCKLQEPFTMDGAMISPVTLDTNYVGGGEMCTLTGWGYNTMLKGVPLPTKLQKLNYPTLTNEECNQRGHNVGPKEVCAISRLGQGACNGDSGGPLVLEGTNTLVGIVSYGTAVCAVNVPDVYTRSSEFVEWIQQNSQ